MATATSSVVANQLASMLAIYMLALILAFSSSCQADRRYFLMPYPVSRSWEPDGLGKVDPEDLILHRGKVEDGETFLVGASYQVKEGKGPKVMRQKGVVIDNTRFRRGSRGLPKSDFRPSPLDLDVGTLPGEWVAGTFPGEYTWRGMNRNPMRPRQYRSSPYQYQP